jgi:hypothetical protein
MLSSGYHPLKYNKSIKQHSIFIISFYSEPNEFPFKSLQTIPKETLQPELPILSLPEWTEKDFQNNRKPYSKPHGQNRN